MFELTTVHIEKFCTFILYPDHVCIFPLVSPPTSCISYSNRYKSHKHMQKWNPPKTNQTRWEWKSTSTPSLHNLCQLCTPQILYMHICLFWPTKWMYNFIHTHGTYHCSLPTSAYKTTIPHNQHQLGQDPMPYVLWWQKHTPVHTSYRR